VIARSRKPPVTTETAAWDDAAEAILRYTTKLVVVR
jgi:hypothetical protein